MTYKSSMSKKSDVITSFSDPQSQQMAINACNNALVIMYYIAECDRVPNWEICASTPIPTNKSVVKVAL